MRPLTSKEIRKRGCEWCTDYKWHKFSEKDCRTRVCIHNICPYRELDKYDTYDDYLKHAKNEGFDVLIGSVFKMQRDL